MQQYCLIQIVCYERVNSIVGRIDLFDGDFSLAKADERLPIAG